MRAQRIADAIQAPTLKDATVEARMHAEQTEFVDKRDKLDEQTRSSITKQNSDQNHARHLQLKAEIKKYAN